VYCNQNQSHHAQKDLKSNYIHTGINDSQLQVHCTYPDGTGNGQRRKFHDQNNSIHSSSDRTQQNLRFITRPDPIRLMDDGSSPCPPLSQTKKSARTMLGKEITLDQLAVKQR